MEIWVLNFGDWFALPCGICYWHLPGNIQDLAWRFKVDNHNLIWDLSTTDVNVIILLLDIWERIITLYSFPVCCMFVIFAAWQGSARRKKKVLHKTTVGDDKKLQTSLKKLGLNPIPSIEEVGILLLVLNTVLRSS